MTIFSINSGSFGDVTVTGIVSASTLKGDGSQITSVSYDNIASKPTLISSSTQVEALLPGGTLSSSAQVDITNTTGYSTFSGSLATIDTTQTNRLNTIESFTGSYATTGSNTFTGIQTFSDTTNTTSYLDGAIHIAGGMSVRQDVRISGSMTINGLLTAVSMSTQYVTSSQYNVGTSRITLNDDDNVRFAGLSIIDSGSSSPTSASILWDSLQHRFIYENLSGSSYNSSIIMAGPKHTGTLGDEVGLTDFRVPVAHGSDHIDSRVASSSIRVDFPSRLTHVEAGLYITGAVTASGGINAGSGLFGTLQTAAQTNVTSVGTLTSLAVTNNITTTNGIISAGADFRLNGNSYSRVADGDGGGAFGGGYNFYLDVSSPKYDSTGNIAGYYYDTGGNVRFFAGGSAAAGTAAPERMRIDSSGNVGIGTTNAGYKLDVYNVGGSTATTRLYGNDQSNVRLRLENVGSGGRIWELVGGLPGANNSNFSLYDVTGTATRLTVDSSGNVGIGTTSPGYKLDVSGSMRVVQGLVMTPQESNLYATNGTLSYYGTTNGVYVNGAGANGFLRLNGAGSENDRNNIDIYGSAQDQIVFRTAASTRMIINSSGNVSIGTTSPLGLLHVNAADTVTGTLIIGGGNVAVTSVGEINSQLDFRSNDASVASTNQIGGRIASVTELSNGAYTGLAFYTYQQDAGTPLSEKMRITFGGNVGIGTTNPSTKLDITSAGAQGLSLSTDLNNSGVSSRLFFGASGGTLSMYGTGTSLYFNTGATVGSTSGNPALIFNANGIGLNGTLPASGVGIKFPATQNASSDANTLDDYEEGTYTPTLVTTTGTPTYSYQEGYYTKIGRQVFGGGIIGITNSSSLTGQIRISIPFTISGATYGYTAGATSDGSGWTFPLTSDNFYQVNLQANNGVSHIGVVGVGISAAVVNYTSSGVGSSWYIRYEFSIRV